MMDGAYVQSLQILKMSMLLVYTTCLTLEIKEFSILTWNDIRLQSYNINKVSHESIANEKVNKKKYYIYYFRLIC
jgi:hypothetical protein